MPEALERELKRRARKKGFSKKRTGAYVYGTLSKIEKSKTSSIASEVKRRAK